MPRVALSLGQRRDYKLRDFKGWVIMQMKLNGKRQADVAEALGISCGRVSQMLKISDPKKDKGKKEEKDPFSYGQVLTLIEYFGISDEEILHLMKL